MTVLPEETLVVDFGQNCSAVPSFVFQAKEGTKLTCLPGELLNDGNGAKSRGMDGPEGSVHRLNLRTPEQGMRVCYTFADAKGDVSYHPTCSFFGYRYVSITATDEVRIRSISSLPVTSIDKEMETGVVATGNEQVNRLISNTLWGQRSNYLSVPTDCPQRNERLGWTADTQVFAETGTFFADTKKFFHKWMRDMRDTQSEFGGFPGVAPIGQYGAEPTSMMRLGWADAGVIVPWTVWKQFGDTQIVEENWDAMERYMDHVNATKYDHETLSVENGNYQWADWLSYEPLESSGGSAFTSDASGKRIPLPEAIVYWNYLSASYWAIDAGMMRDMAAATGRDAGKYETMVSEAKAYLKNTFLDGKGAFKTAILNTMQTPALFALENCLVEGEAKAALTARLRENFAQHGNCLQTGFLGTSILMNTLTENGMADLAWELLFQRKNPSWLYSVDNGATTIWERWNSYMLDKGMGPRGMNSFNHYAYGCVCEWIWKTVCGIAADTAAPGFKRIIMKPVPDKRLGFVKAAYDSAAGRIESEWKYEGDKWIWNFTIPEGATASVTLPGETEAKEYAAGSYTVEQ
jgi:alpha-L-rhamnosidase